MAKRKIKKKVKITIVILCFFGVLLISSSFLLMYLSSPVDRRSDAFIEVEVKSGSSTATIADDLKRRGLIKSSLLFRVMAKFNTSKTLKASVYQFQKSMNLNQILDLLTEGSKYNPDVVKITFVEGETIKKYALKIAEATNHTYEEVMEKVSDTNYLSSLVNQYFFLGEEVLNPNIYVPLEGYLTPNTYEFKNKDVSIEEIFKVMLDQTEKELSPYKDMVEKSGRTFHEYVTLASMLELEGTNETSRKMIAGVFNNRLEIGMNLGSDVTTYYGLQQEMTQDLTAAQFATSNPYNTRAKDMAGKFPIGPICNPSKESIEASFHPTDSSYLFFVADKNGKIYYTKTEKEHLKKVQEIKDAGDWIW